MIQVENGPRIEEKLRSESKRSQVSEVFTAILLSLLFFLSFLFPSFLFPADIQPSVSVTVQLVALQKCQLPTFGAEETHRQWISRPSDGRQELKEEEGKK